MKALLIVELSSHSVSVGLAHHSPNTSVCSLVHTYREYIQYESRPSPQDVLSKASSLLHKVLHEHVPKSAISKVVIVHPLSWSFVSSRRINTKFNKETDITRQLIGQISDSETSKDQTPSEMKFMGRSISDVLVNGYRIRNPWDKKSTRLSAVVSDTYIDTAILQMIEKEVRSAFHTEIEHTTESIAALEALRYREELLGISKSQNDTAFVHISGDTTEVFLASDYILHSTVSIPYGADTISRALATSEKYDQSISQSHIVASIEHTRAFTESESTTYGSEVKTWRNELWKSLQNLSSSHIIPTNIHIVTLPAYKQIALDLCDPVLLQSFSGKPHNISSSFDDIEHSKLFSIEKSVDRDPLITIALISHLI